MPYLKDPRGRVTLNLPAPEYAGLSADAARAGYTSPGTYALALVRARGAALRPVLDEDGAQSVARLKGKLEAVRAALAACQAARTAQTARQRELEDALAERPTRAEYEQMLTEEVARALDARAAAMPPAPAPAETARAPRRHARRPAD